MDTDEQPPERRQFGTAAGLFADQVAAIPAHGWTGPGLGQWDLRSLVGHTSRALVTVETYLQQPADREACATAVDYVAGSASSDPAAVAERGRAAGRALGPDPARFVRDLVDRVVALVDRQADPLITTAAGGMRLQPYLRTRTFELVVHGLDIARAAGLPDPAFPEDLLADAAELSAAVAVRRGRGPQLLRALTGREPLAPDFSVV